MSSIGSTARNLIQNTVVTGTPGGAAAPASPASPSTAPATAQSATLPASLRDVASGARTLEKGSRGDDVKAVQNGLKKLGLLSGAADGIFGNGTANAVAAFQRREGLTPSGRVDQATVTALDKALSSAPAAPLTKSQLFAQGGQSSINTKWKAHNDAIDRTGIGTHYGDKSSYNGLSKQEKKDYIAENAKPGTTPPDPKVSSCIGWALENVRGAYEAAGMGARFNEIYRNVTSKGAKGTDLAAELKKDGWQAIYFNPDAKKAADGNGEHTYTARIVSQGKPYYGVKVDGQVTNYRPTEGGPTKQDLTGVEQLQKIPFFFGLARGGTHTFVGQNGRVNEFHWDRNPDDKTAIEERPLTEFPWNSGILMVPPGSWPPK